MKADTQRECPFCGRRSARCKHSGTWGYFVACACKATGTPASTAQGAWDNWNDRKEPEQDELEF